LTLLVTPFRSRLHRIVLAAAAAYNVAFGLWAALFPGEFFRLFELESPRYPAIWQCLGMVVGLYGVVYAYATLHLDRAKAFVAIGLAGKVLGPIGCLCAAELPLRTFPLILFNDIVWWLPFTLILLEGTRAGERVRAAAPIACAALNAAGAAALLFALRPGTELVPDIGDRVAYIAERPLLWSPSARSETASTFSPSRSSSRGCRRGSKRWRRSARS
jgi:small multidrug resistance pump